MANEGIRFGVGSPAIWQELPSSEDVLQQVTDTLHCGVLIVDQDRKIRFANSTSVRLLGLPPEGVIGSKFCYPICLGKVTEIEVLQPNGLKTTIETQAIETEWGRERYLQIALQDITERKQTERMLRENETLFRTILESAAIGISVNTYEGRPILCNSVLQKMLGYNEYELRNMVFTEFTHPDDRGPDENLLQGLLSGAIDSYQVDKRYIRKDGQIIWGRLTISLLRQSGQDPCNLVAMVEDITNHKRSENELQQSEQRWRSLAENTPDVILTVDPSGNIRYANSGLEGIPANQLVGRKVFDCVLLEHRDQLRKIFEQAVQMGEPTRYEFSGVGFLGILLWYVASLTPIMVQEKVIGVTVVISDISERKHMEDELRDYAHRLEIFREIDQAIHTAQSSVSIVEGALEHILELLPYHWAGVAIVNDDSNELTSLVVREGDRSKSIPDAASLLAALDLSRLMEGKAYEVGNLVQVAHLNPLELLLQKSGLNAYVLLPMLMHGELLGFLGLASRVPDAIQPDQLTNAIEVTDLLSVAILQSRLLSQSQHRAAELEVLAQVSAAFRQIETYPEMLSAVVEQTCAALTADTCGLYLYKNDSFFFAAGQSPCEPFSGCACPEDENCLRQVIRSGQTLRIAIDSNPECQISTNPSRKFTPGLSLVTWVPLRDTNTTIGILVLAFHHRETLSKGKNRLLDAIADIASNALLRTRSLYTLEQQVSDRTRRLSVLYQVTAATSQTDDLYKMLHGSLVAVLAAMPGSAGCVQLLDEGRCNQVLVVECGLPEEIIRMVNRGFEVDTPWEQALTAGFSVRLTRGITERRLPESIRQVGFQAYLGVPIKAGGQKAGVMSVFLQSEPRIVMDDLEVLTAVAGQVGRAVERFDLRKKAEQAIIVEERQRLSRDLHDSITQLLCSESLLAEAGRKFMVRGDVAQASSYMEQLVENAHQALKEMRLMIYDLRPSVLEKEGLAGALNYRLAAVEQRAGMQTCLIGMIKTPLSNQEEEGLYRIAQELLNNVLKHAEATSVEVHLRDLPGQVELEVVDNGKGYNLAATNSGIGLSSIRERVQRLGGTLTISSQAGEGCRVKISLRTVEEVRA
jgi:PAS domain S-box-containing protein